MPLPSISALVQPQGTFRGSERSGCRVSIYGKQGGALSLYGGNQTYDLDGRVDEGVPAVTSCQTQSTLGGGGSFSFTLKYADDFDPCVAINPDAWVDISFTRFATSWLVMRGMVDEVRVSRQVAGTGAAVRVAEISGRSFQKAWATTPMWFNVSTGENIADAALFQVTPQGVAIGSPAENVFNILFKLFGIIGDTGRANWQLPADVPGPSGALADVVAYDQTGFFAGLLPRNSPMGQLFAPDVDLWSWASGQYSDGQFCELFTEILPVGGLAALQADPTLANGLSPADARMTLVMRDKPFPVVDPVAQLPLGAASPWFGLPTYTVDAQDATSSNMGVSTFEALNAFAFVGNFSIEDAAGDSGETKSILWRPDDMQRRGMRRLDVATIYRSADAADRAFSVGMRARLRDWYCMGDELRQGGVELARLFPELRLGCRMRLRGAFGQEDRTGYIEGIRHSWSPNRGRTSCDLTRIWVGTDAELLARLADVSSLYVEPAPL